MSLCDEAAQRWPEQERATARAVCLAESGGRADAYNPRGERSRGLFQINGKAHPQWDNDTLFDPEVNAQVAYGLWQAQGWRPWSAYTVGTYRRYMDGSEAGSEAPSRALGPLAFVVLAVGALLLLEGL